MPKTSSFDDIMQQLDALSLAELLQIRAKVDALIEEKSLPLYKTVSSRIGTAAIGTPAIGAAAIGAAAIGTSRIGAAAIGTPAIGTPAIGTVVIGTAAIGALIAAASEIVSVPILLGVGASVRIWDFGKRAAVAPGHIVFTGLSHTTEVNHIKEYKVVQPSDLKADKDDSLENLIKLVDKWMDDESGYDEETLPQIKAALNQNHTPV